MEPSPVPALSLHDVLLLPLLTLLAVLAGQFAWRPPADLPRPFDRHWCAP